MMLVHCCLEPTCLSCCLWNSDSSSIRITHFSAFVLSDVSMSEQNSHCASLWVFAHLSRVWMPCFVSIHQESQPRNRAEKILWGSSCSRRSEVKRKHLLYVRSLYSPSDFACFLWTDLVRETGIFTAVPGWSVLKTAGLASAAQVGFSCQVTCQSSEFQPVRLEKTAFTKFHSRLPHYVHTKSHCWCVMYSFW